MTNTENKRYTQKIFITIKAHPQEVFSFICETKDNNIYSSSPSELVYSLSGLAEDNCVFRNGNTNDKNESLWIISSFDPGNEIQFVKHSQLSLSLIKVNLSEIDNSKCTVEIIYSITYLSEKVTSDKDIKNEVNEEIKRLKDFFITKFEVSD